MKSCKECVHVFMGKRTLCSAPAPYWMHYSDSCGLIFNIVEDWYAKDCLTYQPREDQTDQEETLP